MPVVEIDGSDDGVQWLIRRAYKYVTGDAATDAQLPDDLKWTADQHDSQLHVSFKTWAIPIIELFVNEFILDSAGDPCTLAIPPSELDPIPNDPDVP